MVTLVTLQSAQLFFSHVLLNSYSTTISYENGGVSVVTLDTVGRRNALPQRQAQKQVTVVDTIWEREVDFGRFIAPRAFLPIV